MRNCLGAYLGTLARPPLNIDVAKKDQQELRKLLKVVGKRPLSCLNDVHAYFALARGSSVGGFCSSANSNPLRYESFTIFAIFSKLIFSTVSVTWW